MSKRRVGLISVRVPPEPPPTAPEGAPDETVSLPPRNVLEAGVKKFLDLTHIGVGRAGTDTFQPFDFADRRLLRIILGLTYLEMVKETKK